MGDEGVSGQSGGPSLDARRRDFLMTVESYAEPAVLRHSEVLLTALVSWSEEHPQLEPSRAGLKQTVGYRLGTDGPALWVAYPKHGDEPALVLLPTLGMELEPDDARALAREIAALPSRWPVEDGGAILVPFSSLADGAARSALTRLLDALIPIAQRYA